MLILLVKHEIFSHSTLFCQHGKKTKIFKNPEMQEVQTRPSASPRTRRQSDSPMEHLLNVQYLNSRSKRIHSASPSHLEHWKQQKANKQKLSQFVHIFISRQI